MHKKYIDKGQNKIFSRRVAIFFFTRVKMFPTKCMDGWVQYSVCIFYIQITRLSHARVEWCACGFHFYPHFLFSWKQTICRRVVESPVVYEKFFVLSEQPLLMMMMVSGYHSPIVIFSLTCSSNLPRGKALTWLGDSVSEFFRLVITRRENILKCTEKCF